MTDTDQSGRCISVAPIMPTTDIARTRQHYARLGFSADVIDNFMMTKRDDIELLFSLNPEHDPKRTASCIYVRVADARLCTHFGRQPAFPACDSCALPTTKCVSLLTWTPTAT